VALFPAKASSPVSIIHYSLFIIHKDLSMTLHSPDYLDQRYVSQSFERAAPVYEQWDNLPKMIGEYLLERLEGLNLHPEQILDIGAGTGRLLRALRQQYAQAHLYAVDISMPMLQQARHQASPGDSTPHLICAEATQLPIPNDCIDLLISNLMLPWCNDIHSVFAEFARVLTPQGTLLFSTLGTDTLKELRHSWGTVDNTTHVHKFWDMHDLGDALLATGLSNPVMDVDRFEPHYKEVSGLMQELKQSGAHNVTTGRPRGLTGRGKFQGMLTVYEQYRTNTGELPATIEVVYGYASGKTTVAAPKPSWEAVTMPRFRR
jgi:malonyl-CoA O-methyltransferase